MHTDGDYKMSSMARRDLIRRMSVKYISLPDLTVIIDLYKEDHTTKKVGTMKSLVAEHHPDDKCNASVSIYCITGEYIISNTPRASLSEYSMLGQSILAAKHVLHAPATAEAMNTTDEDSDDDSAPALVQDSDSDTDEDGPPESAAIYFEGAHMDGNRSPADSDDESAPPLVKDSSSDTDEDGPPPSVRDSSSDTDDDDSKQAYHHVREDRATDSDVAINEMNGADFGARLAARLQTKGEVRHASTDKVYDSDEAPVLVSDSEDDIGLDIEKVKKTVLQTPTNGELSQAEWLHPEPRPSSANSSFQYLSFGNFALSITQQLAKIR